MSAALVPHLPMDYSCVLVARLARLGCTRIGSPGIFGVHTRETSS